MRKVYVLLLVVALLVLLPSSFQSSFISAHERDYNTLKALSFGVGLPFECKDLPGAGLTANIGYDCAYTINDRFALGFYLTGGGGFWGEFRKYSNVDHFHVAFRLTAGLMMQIGDPKAKPWLLGVAPCTGFGLYDHDVVLPVELRFGKFINDRWYIMGELTYHASLAAETVTIEPAIRVGYHFGRKVKSRTRH